MGRMYTFVIIINSSMYCVNVHIEICGHVMIELFRGKVFSWSDSLPVEVKYFFF